MTKKNPKELCEKRKNLDKIIHNDGVSHLDFIVVCDHEERPKDPNWYEREDYKVIRWMALKLPEK